MDTVPGPRGKTPIMVLSHHSPYSFLEKVWDRKYQPYNRNSYPYSYKGTRPMRPS